MKKIIVVIVTTTIILLSGGCIEKIEDIRYGIPHNKKFTIGEYGAKEYCNSNYKMENILSSEGSYVVGNYLFFILGKLLVDRYGQDRLNAFNYIDLTYVYMDEKCTVTYIDRETRVVSRFTQATPVYRPNDYFFYQFRIYNK